MNPTKILVAMDGSPASAEAMAWVATFAHTLRAEVVAVHAVGLLERFASQELSTEEMQAELHQTAENEWCAPLRHAGVLHEVVVRPGDPVEQILELAGDRNADLIVVGTRGAFHSEFQRLGSTSHRVIEASPVPVVVIPPPRV